MEFHEQRRVPKAAFSRSGAHPPHTCRIFIFPFISRTAARVAIWGPKMASQEPPSPHIRFSANKVYTGDSSVYPGLADAAPLGCVFAPFAPLPPGSPRLEVINDCANITVTFLGSKVRRETSPWTWTLEPQPSFRNYAR